MGVDGNQKEAQDTAMAGDANVEGECAGYVVTYFNHLKLADKLVENLFVA